jgi:fucose 4-O-acetylase-like acetyltransferase
VAREARSLEPSTRARTSARLVALDAGRALATFGVVFTHAAEVQGLAPALAALGRFGTSFYVAAAMLLAVRSGLDKPGITVREDARARAGRLLVPFALWSLVYGAYYTLDALAHGSGLEGLTTWWGPFAGCARHLWFLPFAFVAGVGARASAPWVARLSTRRLLATTLLGGALSYWVFLQIVFFLLDRTWLVDHQLHRLDRWVEEIPLALVATGLAHLYVRLERSRARGATYLRLLPGGAPSERPSSPGEPSARGLSGLVPLLALCFVLLEGVYLTLHTDLIAASQSEARFVANAAGLALLSAFLLAKPRRWMARVGGLGRYTYFAFLAHVLVLDALNGLLVGLPGFGTAPFALLFALVAFGLSLLLGRAVRGRPALRWLTP